MSQTLYRFWSAEEGLLYVGISARPWERWKQHRGDKPWWEEVASVTLEDFPTREAVRQAELTAIRTENPRYNIADRYAHAPVGLSEVMVECRCQAARTSVPRQPSVKFVEDAWPDTWAALRPLRWKAYAREWLTDGLTRAEIREALAIAAEAYGASRTRNPWGYATGVLRRMASEKGET